LEAVILLASTCSWHSIWANTWTALPGETIRPA